MKILYISRRFYPEIKGGGQISAFYLAKTIKKLGHEIVVCTFSDEKKDKIETIDGILIYRLSIPKLKFFPRLSNMDYMYLQMAHLSSKIIEKEKPDILHLLNFESIPISSIYFKKRFKLPIVATVNGPLFGCFTQGAIDYKGETCTECKLIKRIYCSQGYWGKVAGSLYSLYSLWYMNMLKFSYKYVDRFLTISSSMTPLLLSMDVPEEKITLVNNLLGEDLKIDKILLASFKKKFKDKKIILYTGRLAKEKGVEFTLSALPYLPKEFVFLIAGWGENEKNLKNMANDLGVQKRVFFLGRIDYKKIGTYYSLSDIFSHFPTFYEPFGRTLIEAMCFGKVVVAYPIAGINDIIKDNENGLLIKSRDPRTIAKCISGIMNDKKRYKKLADSAIRTVKEKFSNETVANKYIDSYRGLLR
jgi:glycosyltransferase involved in cell wall biosynthesis